MNEEQVTRYLEDLEDRGRELVAQWDKAQEVLESAGIVDSSGELTEAYK